MKKLSEINEQHNKLLSSLEAKIAKQAKQAIKETFSNFFTAHPEVEAIKWAQYTPNWNDGDVCTFHVYDFNIKLDGMTCFLNDDDDDSDVEMSDQLDRALGELETEACAAEKVFQLAFGDHVEVTINRDLKVNIDHYEHD